MERQKEWDKSEYVFFQDLQPARNLQLVSYNVLYVALYVLTFTLT